MATIDRGMEWFLERSPVLSRQEAESVPREIGRRSMEAFISNHAGSPRDLASHGYLHLSGPSVTEHRAELGLVGALAIAWQKAVSATGAALEQVRGLRGALPGDITLRTALVLNAEPRPGSVVLNFEPKSPPRQEVEPSGNLSMFEPPRPLADRASGRLIEFLAALRSDDSGSADAVANALNELGPRVGSAITNLASVIQVSNFTVDAAWEEPSHDQVVARVTPTEAAWLQAFIAGRGLDAEERVLKGYLRTVSDRDRWLVELMDGTHERMDASELLEDEVPRWRVGDAVSLTVRVALREQPDGVTRRSTTILSVRSLEDEA